MMSSTLRSLTWPASSTVKPLSLSNSVRIPICTAFAPGTGTPVIGGLTSDRAIKLVRGLKDLNIVGMSSTLRSLTWPASSTVKPLSLSNSVRIPICTEWFGCLDPAFAPGTGTPVIGGLTSDRAIKLVRGLKDLNAVVNLARIKHGKTVIFIEFGTNTDLHGVVRIDKPYRLPGSGICARYRYAGDRWAHLRPCDQTGARPEGGISPTICFT
jgi:hypothetical protein